MCIVIKICNVHATKRSDFVIFEDDSIAEISIGVQPRTVIIVRYSVSDHS